MFANKADSSLAATRRAVRKWLSNEMLQHIYTLQARKGIG